MAYDLMTIGNSLKNYAVLKWQVEIHILFINLID